MKRTRAQQPKVEEPQDPSATVTAANPKPQRRAKQPRQPKAAGGANKTKPGAAGSRIAAAAAASVASAAAAAANAGSAASSPGPPEMAPTVPDVYVGVRGDAGADDARAVDWDLDDAGLNAAAAWWTWGVDEEKLLGWFPFVEEDFRCAGGRAGDAEVAAFDHDIWSIW
jgi:hypothetical protein